MEMVQINGKSIIFNTFQLSEKDHLLNYFNGLSVESKARFAPHPFTSESVSEIVSNSSYYQFVAKTLDEDLIIAYAILKKGWLQFENPRLESYGLKPCEGDFTIAPSVADGWQGRGLGTQFFMYLIDYAKHHLNAKRFILWGGVQSDNSKAVKLYLKCGFEELGQFEYNGINYDMILTIN
jgi:GNAT superfamily N-acetyltransferase